MSNVPLEPALHQNPRSHKRSDLEEREEGREELKLKRLEEKLELNFPEKRVISSQRTAPFALLWFNSKGHIEKPKSRGMELNTRRLPVVSHREKSRSLRVGMLE